MNVRRWSRLSRYAQEQHLDALYISDPDDVRYLSGFGTGQLLIIGADERHLLVPATDAEEARASVVGCQVLVAEGDRVFDEVTAILRRVSPDRLGYSTPLSHDAFLRLERLAHQRQLCRQLVVMRGLGRWLRGVKDERMLDEICRCCRVVDRVFSRILQVTEPGITELDLAAEIEWMLRKAGAEDRAFPTLVASGFRSAFPHAAPTRRRLHPGELVLVDFGARIGDGTSDLSRTLVLGEADPEQQQVHESVLRAQEAAIADLVPGRTGEHIHRVAERVIAAAGYGAYLVHGTGHSIGGGPDLTTDEVEPLVAGNVVTVEPGVYIRGWGGVRIEDVVLVTEDGGQVLTSSSRRLIEV